MVKKHNRSRARFNFIYLFLMLVYFISFFKNIVFKNGFTTSFKQVNLTPFYFLKEYTSQNINLKFLLRHIFASVGMFIPLGIFKSKASEKKGVFRNTFSIFLFIIFIRAVQYLIGLDKIYLDDLFFNTIGAFLGSFIYIYLLDRIDLKYKKPVASVYFLIFFTIIAFASRFFIQSDLIKTNSVEYLNEEVLNGLDPKEYDYKGEITNVYSDIIDVNVIVKNENGLTEHREETFYIKDTDLFIAIKSSDFGGDNKVKNTIIGYDKLDIHELKDYIDRDQRDISIWMEEGSISKMILNVDNDEN